MNYLQVAALVAMKDADNDLSVGGWLLVGGIMAGVGIAFALACVFALMGEEIEAKWRERRARRRL